MSCSTSPTCSRPCGPADADGPVAGAVRLRAVTSTLARPRRPTTASWRLPGGAAARVRRPRPACPHPPHRRRDLPLSGRHGGGPHGTRPTRGTAFLLACASRQFSLCSRPVSGLTSPPGAPAKARARPARYDELGDKAFRLAAEHPASANTSRRHHLPRRAERFRRCGWAFNRLSDRVFFSERVDSERTAKPLGFRPGISVGTVVAASTSLLRGLHETHHASQRPFEQELALHDPAMGPSSFRITRFHC